MSVVEAGTATVLKELGAYETALPLEITDFSDRISQHVCDTRVSRLMLALVIASEEDQALRN